MSTSTVSVWKFDLRDDAEQTVRMPRGAKVLSVQLQGETVRVWALVDPQEPVVRRTFWMMVTGGSANPDGLGAFVGTVQCGAFVVHVFDGGERSEGGA